jgi:hypothetical protein
MRVSCYFQVAICIEYTSEKVKGKSSFVVIICFITYQSAIPEHQPEISQRGAQLVGFNNESFHRPTFISLPINVGIPTGTDYYTNDNDYEGEVGLIASDYNSYFGYKIYERPYGCYGYFFTMFTFVIKVIIDFIITLVTKVSNALTVTAVTLVTNVPMVTMVAFATTISLVTRVTSVPWLLCLRQRARRVSLSGHFVSYHKIKANYIKLSHPFGSTRSAKWNSLHQNNVKFGILFTEAAITGWFLGALAKLRKATISFVMSVSHSVRSLAWNNTTPAGKDFRGTIHCWVLIKSAEEIQVWLKSDRKDILLQTSYIYD